MITQEVKFLLPLIHFQSRIEILSWPVNLLGKKKALIGSLKVCCGVCLREGCTSNDRKGGVGYE